MWQTKVCLTHSNGGLIVGLKQTGMRQNAMFTPNTICIGLVPGAT